MGPSMGPSLVNVQLEGSVAYMQAIAGDFHLPQISMRCGGMESDCSCAAPNLRHECQRMVRQRHLSACSKDANAAARCVFEVMNAALCGWCPLRARNLARKSPHLRAQGPMLGCCIPARPFVPRNLSTPSSGAAVNASEILSPKAMDKAVRETTSQS